MKIITKQITIYLYSHLSCNIQYYCECQLIRIHFTHAGTCIICVVVCFRFAAGADNIYLNFDKFLPHFPPSFIFVLKYSFFYVSLCIVCCFLLFVYFCRSHPLTMAFYTRTNMYKGRKKRRIKQNELRTKSCTHHIPIQAHSHTQTI